MRDLIGIAEYTEAHRGHEAAGRVAGRLYDGIDALEQFPDRARPGRRANTRELSFVRLPFVAVNRVHDNEEVIEVLPILHGAQRWP